MGRPRYDVRATVISIERPCALGHQVGDTWELGEFTPGGMCVWAYSALLPRIEALYFGATYPWQDDPDEIMVACPDHLSEVVFRLERRPVGEWPDAPVESTLEVTAKPGTNPTADLSRST
jgi:uncharacterized repeat protein (TIGR04076 family)